MQHDPCLFQDKWIRRVRRRVARYTLRLSDDERSERFRRTEPSLEDILHRVRIRIGPPPEGTDTQLVREVGVAYRTYEPLLSTSPHTSDRRYARLAHGQTLKLWSNL